MATRVRYLYWTHGVSVLERGWNVQMSVLAEIVSIRFIWSDEKLYNWNVPRMEIRRSMLDFDNKTDTI